MKVSLLFLYGLILSQLFSCTYHKGPEVVPVTPTGILSLHFTNFAGTDTLKLNQVFTNSSSENFTPTQFNYYISNIKLLAPNGTVLWAEPDSYHLLQQADLNSLKFNMNVPTGEYAQVTFLLGVDSLRNVSGAQSGALDPLNGMFWTWNSGYVMLKLEATSPVSPAVNNIVEYHVGGFSGVNSVLKTLTFTLPSVINMRKDLTSEVYFNTDLLKLFTQPVEISIATMPTVSMPGVNAKKLADNYADMFSVVLVINN